MIYEWKIPGIYGVDAQTAGEELNRIYEQNGRLEPAKIVDESRSETAPLHSCFEWDNDKAAEKYREVQAANIVRAIVTVVDKDDGTADTARAFVTVETKNYEPLEVVCSCATKREILLQKALGELNSFRKKYKTLTEIKPVLDAIDELIA